MSCYALFKGMAASKPTSWLSSRLNILLTLSHTFGTLADGLGCSPLDHGPYRSWSDSQALAASIRSLIGFGNVFAPLAQSVLYLQRLLPEASPKAISGRTSYLRVRLEFLPYPQLIRRLFNDDRFGPPCGLTHTSPWPRVDHPVSGLLTHTMRPVQTRFPCGSSALSRLSLACVSNSPDRSSISTTSG